MSRKERFTLAEAGKWQDKFIEASSEVPSVKHAGLRAGIGRREVYRLRERNAEFAAKWAEVLDLAIDELEARAFKLALEGDDHVAANLLTFLLRCHRPELYRETNRFEIDARLCGVIILPEKEKLPP